MTISTSVLEYKGKDPIYVSKHFCGREHVDLLLKGEGEKNTVFLSNIFIRSSMFTHYIVEEKWDLVRYLNPANDHATSITKDDKDFGNRCDFIDIKFPVKATAIHKFQKNISARISVFGFENREKHPIYVSKQISEEKHVPLLLKWQGEKNTLFLAKILISSCMSIQNIVEKKWCLVRYLNPSNHHVTSVTKDDKDFPKRLDFKDIKLPVKIRDIGKIEKKNSVGITIFRYETMEKTSNLCMKTILWRNHIDSVLKSESQKTPCS